MRAEIDTLNIAIKLSGNSITLNLNDLSPTVLNLSLPSKLRSILYQAFKINQFFLVGRSSAIGGRIMTISGSEVATGEVDL